jgi:hypothetical protein
MSAPEINLCTSHSGSPRAGHSARRTDGWGVRACVARRQFLRAHPVSVVSCCYLQVHWTTLYYTVEVRRREKVCVRTCWCCVLTSGIYTETRATYAGRKRAACMLLLYLSEIETKGSRCTWGACWDSFLAHFLKVLCLGSNNFL